MANDPHALAVVTTDWGFHDNLRAIGLDEFVDIGGGLNRRPDRHWKIQVSKDGSHGQLILSKMQGSRPRPDFYTRGDEFFQHSRRNMLVIECYDIHRRSKSG